MLGDASLSQVLREVVAINLTHEERLLILIDPSRVFSGDILNHSIGVVSAHNFFRNGRSFRQVRVRECRGHVVEHNIFLLAALSE